MDRAGSRPRVQHPARPRDELDGGTIDALTFRSPGGPIDSAPSRDVRLSCPLHAGNDAIEAYRIERDGAPMPLEWMVGLP